MLPQFIIPTVLVYEIMQDFYDIINTTSAGHPSWAQALASHNRMPLKVGDRILLCVGVLGFTACWLLVKEGRHLPRKAPMKKVL